MNVLRFTLILLAQFLSSCGGGGGGSDSSSGSSSNNGGGDNGGTDNGGTDNGETDNGAVIVAEPVSDRTVAFSTEDEGLNKAVPLWGLDTAWPSTENMLRGVRFMGSEQVDLVRISFTPTAPLVAGALQADELNLLNQRIGIAELASPAVDVVLNADAPAVDDWFKNVDGTFNAANWAQLIDVTRQHVESRGHKVVAAAPFNEPDYWGSTQGTMQDFYNIAVELRSDPNFDGVRLTGGNTLDPDFALDWYNFFKDKLDEGNTHQLAGAFDSYAGFFEQVVADGLRAVNDELHNVMEAMVGVEYGLQTGIWWGTAERARGEFVKASDGKRLGYAEHRPNWTAASVYRAPNGKVKAFGGASERQATTTTYRFVSKDRDVFYNGVGPKRQYTMTIEGGTGYQIDQLNAESVVDITWGEDIQPVVNGRYFLVNRNSELVLEVAQATTDDGANVQQGFYAGDQNQLWDFAPLSPRNGGDFSYFKVTAAHSGKALDVNGFSLDDGGNIHQWTYLNGSNQHWFLNYEGDGWFSVCSRYSALCLETADSSVSPGGNIQQAAANGENEQLWRLIPEGADLEFDAPGAPAGLQAVGQQESIRLDWNANTEADLAGYTLLRAEALDGPYETIAGDLDVTGFTDHGVASGISYYYKLRASDRSLNRSGYSSEVMAAATGLPGLVAHLQLDGDTLDSTVNENHGVVSGELTYGEAKEGTASLDLNGNDQFVQLPATIANHAELTIATWVFWNGGDAWQRIFDFGNDESEYMYLTPKAGSGAARFAINAGEGQQSLETSDFPVHQWIHVALVFDSTGATLYLDGVPVDPEAPVTLAPVDISPVANFIGRSQFPDPLFNGRIDDFRVYSYGLSAAEVQDIVSAAN